MTHSLTHLNFKAIMKSSQNEAVRLALMLKDRPAPPMPYFESSNSIYDQQFEGYSLTHSLTYSLTYSLTHLITYSLTHLLTHSLTFNFTIQGGCFRRLNKDSVLTTTSTSTTSGRRHCKKKQELVRVKGATTISY